LRDVRGKGSELPERFGAFAPLLGSGEADVGQRAIVQVAQVLPRASAFAPKHAGREEGGPHAIPPRLPRRIKEAKGVLGKRLSGERHLFQPLIHLFQRQNSYNWKENKRKRYECFMS
jgi:hypothetical protein